MFATNRRQTKKRPTEKVVIMAEYNMKLVRSIEIEKIKSYVSVEDYLACKGYHPTRKSAKIAYYLAPWRQEKEPSLAVYYHKDPQDWYDYGERVGGTVIDLAKKIHNGDYKKAMEELRAIINLPNLSP